MMKDFMHLWLPHQMQSLAEESAIKISQLSEKNIWQNSLSVLTSDAREAFPSEPQRRAKICT